jgi:acyl-CoA synthetase (AMP-forming)/AMP-acid ligase II
MTGFYKVDRRTVFTPDGFYPTNDLVRIDADGYAFFVGRAGDMIKTSSANVSRLEVEAALNALPEVELSLVAGLPDRGSSARSSLAAVVPSPVRQPDPGGPHDRTTGPALRGSRSRAASCSSRTTTSRGRRPGSCSSSTWSRTDRVPAGRGAGSWSRGPRSRAERNGCRDSSSGERRESHGREGEAPVGGGHRPLRQGPGRPRSPRSLSIAPTSSTP